MFAINGSVFQNPSQIQRKLRKTKRTMSETTNMKIQGTQPFKNVQSKSTIPGSNWTILEKKRSERTNSFSGRGKNDPWLPNPSNSPPRMTPQGLQADFACKPPMYLKN